MNIKSLISELYGEIKECAWFWNDCVLNKYVPKSNELLPRKSLYVSPVITNPLTSKRFIGHNFKVGRSKK